MDANLQQSEYATHTSPKEMVAIEGSNPQNLPMLLPASEPENQLQEFGQQVSDFLANLPENIGRFFSDYKKPIINIGLFIAAIVTVKVVLAILDAINEIPLLSPTFELVGISYSTWFTFRYLLKDSTRQELSANIQSLNKQTFGSNLSEM
ncbi:CAAD domain-containing protein [Plectonema radiosum NIES-515]|uniref:CAAD domain-containing protein n=1 Tax=Plectonema radiosum NIES-515 TaxID=2986073 RepID=A0ABT3ASE5_9CYAN|nr:CAAD domain-containing protein [Plectonema radiosum]MCV3212038.1 CAAD domain-containing protein [Plectonema radiosum NIES-515]